MNIWHDISKERISPENFIGVIEITKGSKAKYELDKETGMILLDRVLSTSMQYPANYGFIPRTLAYDNDPLDILLLSTVDVNPGTLVECKPIGVIYMIDGGERDEKIICVSHGDPAYRGYNDVSELPAHIFDEMKHFFRVYKDLENKKMEVKELKGREDAMEMIKLCMDLYDKEIGK